MSKGFASTYRIFLLAALVFASLAGLAARLVWLQVLHRQEFLAFLSKSRREILVLHARRGDIVDARGNLLATSLAMREVGVDPQDCKPADEGKWPALAAALGRPEAEVAAILTTRFRPAAPATRSPEGVGRTGAPAAGSASRVVVFSMPGTASSRLSTGPKPQDDADDDTVVDDADGSGRRPIRWAKLGIVSESDYARIAKLGIRGIYGNRIYRRYYPDNDLAAHVIGWVNHDETPIAGIESYADFYLRGQNGWIETEKDGRQQELAQFRTREVDASDGYNVILSLDAAVQRMAEDEMARIVETYQPKKATIIVSDLRPGSTGFVLALANYPTFNPNEYNRLPKDMQGALRNIAATDQYEPGSVFKIVPASAALNEGLVTPETTFDCSLETIDYHGLKLRLPREFSGEHFERLTVAEIIDKSSNKGAAQLGMMLGPERLYRYARAFGFGEPTGFPMVGEIRGTLHTPEDMKRDALMITREPMGQAVAATPLQMQQAMSVVATGGVLYRPQVIREIRDSSGALVYRFGPDPVRRVVRADVARTMERLLMGVAAPSGTAPGAAVPGYEVAGKTGTAQKVEPVLLASGKWKLAYSEHHSVTSFVGFFPATDPEVAISVIVDDPDARVRGRASGAKVAAPAFKDLAERLIAYAPLDIRQPNQAVQPASGALAMEGGSR